jgi:hypothetical protein
MPTALAERPKHYWAVAIFRESFEARRFGTEREAMAYAQVHARMPDAEFVAVDACAANGQRTPIWEWGEEAEERRH